MVDRFSLFSAARKQDGYRGNARRGKILSPFTARCSASAGRVLPVEGRASEAGVQTISGSVFPGPT